MSQESVFNQPNFSQPEGPIKVIPHIIDILDVSLESDVPTSKTAGQAAQKLQDTYNSIVATGGKIAHIHKAPVYGSDYRTALFFVVEMPKDQAVSDFDVVPAPTPTTVDTEYSI